MSAIAHPVRSTKQFVRQHPIASAVIATVTTVAVMEKIGLNQHDRFLKQARPVRDLLPSSTRSDPTLKPLTPNTGLWFYSRGMHGLIMRDP
jgi:hypothetical protein